MAFFHVNGRSINLDQIDAIEWRDTESRANVITVRGVVTEVRGDDYKRLMLATKRKFPDGVEQ